MNRHSNTQTTPNEHIETTQGLHDDGGFAVEVPAAGTVLKRLLLQSASGRALSMGLFLLLLLATGCDSQSLLSQEESTDPAENVLTDEEQAHLTGLGLSANKRDFSISRASMLTFSGEDRVGHARMVRLDGGLMATVTTGDLEPGTATTLWMVVFNAPEYCSGGACGSDDFSNPDVRADLLWVDGQVIGPSGRARYFIYKPEHDVTGSIADPLLGAPAYGVEDVPKTEVHYVVRTHGSVIPGFEYEMTHTFNGCCQLNGLPEDPRLGPVGPNICKNLQFAIHLP